MSGRMIFSDFVIGHLFDEADEQIIIKSNDFERLPENFGDISMTSTQDYDGDGVPDVEEIDWEIISIYADTLFSTRNSNVVLPKLNTFMANKDSYMLKINIDRFNQNNEVHDLDRYAILAVDSSPVDQDSDKDGFNDLYEKTYGQDREKKMNVNKRDDTEVNDSAIDDTFVFNKDTSLSKDSGYGDCIGISLNKVELSYEKEYADENDYYKNILKYERKYNTKARYILTPSENSDYFVNLVAPEQDRAMLIIKQINKKKNGIYEYIEITNEIEKVLRTINTKNGIRYGSISAILEKGKTYCIEVVSLNDEIDGKYTITFEQDNWVYAPKGCLTSCKFDWYTDGSHQIYVPRDVIENLFYRLMKWYIYKDEFGHFSQDIFEQHCEVVADKLLKEDYNVKKYEDKLKYWSTSSDNGTQASWAVAFLGKFGTVPGYILTFNSFLSLCKVSEIKNDMTKYRDSMEYSLINGKVNVVYNYVDKLEPLRRWSAWNEAHYVNKYTQMYYGLDNYGSLTNLYRQDIDVNIEYYRFGFKDDEQLYWVKLTSND